MVVNADDFGRSRAINQAVIRAHREGVLTTASLMVAGDAWEEAVDFARENPRRASDSISPWSAVVPCSRPRGSRGWSTPGESSGPALPERASDTGPTDRLREPLRAELEAQF